MEMGELNNRIKKRLDDDRMKNLEKAIGRAIKVVIY